ncbi:MAG: hypothetical protein KGH75_04970 [Rhodospirillales bacterium]|nr:hypothetical protein [Rhodospirillales bacterium]
MEIHPSVTQKRVMEAAYRRHDTLDNPGICLLCGADAEGVEPDAQEYECEVCGEASVYGAEELLMHMDLP